MSELEIYEEISEYLSDEFETVPTSNVVKCINHLAINHVELFPFVVRSMTDAELFLAAFKVRLTDRIHSKDDSQENRIGEMLASGMWKNLPDWSKGSNVKPDEHGDFLIESVDNEIHRRDWSMDRAHKVGYFVNNFVREMEE